MLSINDRRDATSSRCLSGQGSSDADAEDGKRLIPPKDNMVGHCVAFSPETSCREQHGHAWPAVCAHQECSNALLPPEYSGTKPQGLQKQWYLLLNGCQVFSDRCFCYGSFATRKRPHLHECRSIPSRTPAATCPCAPYNPYRAHTLLLR